MDILERLRAREYFDTWNGEFVSKEAADEIERLRTGNRLHLELAEIKEAEIERLREALDDMIQFVRKEYGSNDVRVQRAEAVLKEKE